MKMKEFAKKVTGREEKEKAKREEMLRMAMDLIENEDEGDDCDIPFDAFRKHSDREHRSIHFYDHDDPTEAESLAYTIADNIDIRHWDEDHKKMTKGITLTAAEAKTLAEILEGRTRSREASRPPRDDMER